MNILKIKLTIILFATIICGISIDTTAQTSWNPKNYGYQLHSNHGTQGGIQIRLNSADPEGEHFGGIFGTKRNVDGITAKRFELRGDDNTEKLSIVGDNIGIGTRNPKARLDVNGWSILRGPVVIGNSIDLAKNINNGSLTGQYRLFVDKGILTEKVKCAIKTTGDWADYVFEEDYEMMDINDLEGFVTENKHLPNVPSAEEMVANGLDVAKMDAKLLEKIEEAYLYIIDMNKEMKAMNEKVDALANENGELKASISAISTSGK